MVFSLAIALLTVVVVFVAKHGVGSLSRAPAWAAAAVKLKLSLEQDASAAAYYARTSTGPLPLATIVEELRAAWPKKNIAVIHTAALEVGTALLHRSDIEAGEIIGGKFTPSTSPAWETDERMRSTVTAATTFFEDDRVYVFRRK